MKIPVLKIKNCARMRKGTRDQPLGVEYDGGVNMCIHTNGTVHGRRITGVFISPRAREYKDIVLGLIRFYCITHTVFRRRVVSMALTTTAMTTLHTMCARTHYDTSVQPLVKETNNKNTTFTGPRDYYVQENIPVCAALLLQVHTHTYTHINTYKMITVRLYACLTKENNCVIGENR